MEKSKRKKRESEGSEVHRDSWQAMMEPSVHRDPRIINIDDLRPLFGPDETPLVRAIAPVYEPAGRSLPLSLSFPFRAAPLLVAVAVDRRGGDVDENAFSVTRDVTI